MSNLQGEKAFLKRLHDNQQARLHALFYNRHTVWFDDIDKDRLRYRHNQYVHGKRGPVIFDIKAMADFLENPAQAERSPVFSIPYNPRYRNPGVCVDCGTYLSPVEKEWSDIVSKGFNIDLERKQANPIYRLNPDLDFDATRETSIYEALSRKASGCYGHERQWWHGHCIACWVSHWCRAALRHKNKGVERRYGATYHIYCWSLRDTTDPYLVCGDCTDDMVRAFQRTGGRRLRKTILRQVQATRKETQWLGIAKHRLAQVRRLLRERNRSNTPSAASARAKTLQT